MKKSVLVIDNDMDTQLPECNGCEVLKVMRQTKAVPILVLSAKVDVIKRTEILKAGANVYLEKPYDLNEVLAQARSLIALCTTSIPLENQHYTIAVGTELIVDPTYWRVTLNGQQIELTHKEFSLLYCLASHRGQVLSKEQLYRHVWNDDSEINLEATIKSHIRTLRLKRGFTQEKIAEALGVDSSFYSRIESGKKGCSVDLLIQFSELYHVSLDYLILGRYGGATSNLNDNKQLKEDVEQLVLCLERFKKVL